MAQITRCDNCKKLSDEPGIGYIGQSWSLKEYRIRIAKIELTKDLCGNCVREKVKELSLEAYDSERDDY